MIRAITIKNINIHYSYSYDYKELVIQTETKEDLKGIKKYLEKLYLPFKLINDPLGEYLKTSYSIIDIKKAIENLRKEV